MNYIFDFDGTLMDTSGLILATIRETIREMGLPDRTDGQCRAIIGIRTDEAGEHLYPGSGISNKEFAETFRRCYNRLKDGADEKPFPGVIPTLRRLREAGHGLAIASSRRCDSLVGYLDRLGITDWFAAIVGGDSVSKGKPDPEPVLTILDSLGWTGDNTLVVGDADVDILMGNAAGCVTCAVTYGNGSIASLEKAAPDHTINHFSDILDMLPDKP